MCLRGLNDFQMMYLCLALPEIVEREVLLGTHDQGKEIDTTFDIKNG